MAHWRGALGLGRSAGRARFVRHVDANPSAAVIVDCAASAAIARRYQ
jgi:hypothetical protein